MTPQEHAQIAEINQQWRNMNRPIDIEEKRRREKEYLALSDNEARGFDFGWDAAVAYLSEPGRCGFWPTRASRRRTTRCGSKSRNWKRNTRHY